MGPAIEVRQRATISNALGKSYGSQRNGVHVGSDYEEDQVD